MCLISRGNSGPRSVLAADWAGSGRRIMRNAMATPTKRREQRDEQGNLEREVPGVGR